MYLRLSVALGFLLLLFTAPALTAQQLDYRQGELIVQFSPDVDGKTWIVQHPEIDDWRLLGRTMNTYLVYFDHDRFGERHLRERYWRDAGVVNVQLNHLVEMRRRPNDQRYNDQWYFRNVGQIGGVTGADIAAELAWDTTTGGLTGAGDTIVICVIDAGIDLDHEDLVDNTWINRDEIPGNGMDDDNNGYADDVFGWNTANNNNNVDAGGDSHGSAVSGIIGARGDNSIGIAGINWTVKVMQVRNNFNSSESEVVEAYSYALDARKDYDASGGTAGAYVVATNASWGRNRGQADESPIWCALYDSLGRRGILNMGAAANINLDVEVEGDLPTTCPSEYLIGVSSVTTFDERENGSAFGAVSIDLSAYGRDVFSLQYGNTYGNETGTSFATPMVTGAAGLLFSAPCDRFQQLLRADPPAAALFVREVILSTTRQNADLAGLTVTEGVLDLGAAMTEMMSRCDDCLPPTSFTVQPVTDSPNGLVIDWRAIEDVEPITLRYRLTGTEDWTSVANATAPFLIEELPTCTSYDVQLLGACEQDEVATEIITASTDGCCVIPEDFRVEALSDQRFFASWTDLLAARRYRVRYRPVGTMVWDTSITTQSILIISGLEACTEYELEFSTDCDTTVLAFGDRQQLLSTGCGACVEEDYCQPVPFDNNREWIQSVNLANLFNNNSGANGNGYGDFGERSSQLLVPGGVYPITVTPGFSENEESEAFRVYVDWNQDGFFSSNEVAAEGNNPLGGSFEQEIVVPQNADPGLTRMRIVMQYPTIRGGACPNISGEGEIEDYCIRVGAVDGCPPPRNLTASFDEDNGTTTLVWSASAAPGSEYVARYRLRGTTDAWTELSVSTNQVVIAGLNLCAAYEVEVASQCDEAVGEFRLFRFMDDCTFTRDLALNPSSWSLGPNPAVDQLTVSWRHDLLRPECYLYAPDGRLLNFLPGGETDRIAFRVDALPAGLYFVRLLTADGRSGVRKVVVKK
ncbi:S8 family serine peptidase [Lewinella sp. W8]|uniref:S8 family serine peptidase n=1 Tax=Lewinella sp. W8 TaxID=2528208 RepID=UPI0010687526|nr:S8 family serine peptidase [Lewinella sp. W8]MTB51613.1 S8 family serine peptidase [Lewinella sp. W8]